jgi:hypothetical protein
MLLLPMTEIHVPMTAAPNRAEYSILPLVTLAAVLLTGLSAQKIIALTELQFILR